MAHKQQPVLQLEVKPSPRLNYAKITLHLLAITAVMTNTLPIWVQVGFSIALLGHLYWTLTSFNTAAIKIKHRDIAGWEVAVEDEFTSVQILPSTVITTLLVIVHFKILNSKDKNGVKTVLIPFDALNEKDFRHLIVRLKTSR